MKKEVSSPDAAAAPTLLSQAIDTGSLVFVAGQINNNPQGDMVGESVEDKIRQIMHNIESILKAAELDLDSIVKATVFVTDMAQMPEINKLYPTYFTSPLPAREAVCVKELPLGATIEISVIASH